MNLIVEIMAMLVAWATRVGTGYFRGKLKIKPDIPNPVIVEY